MTELSQAEERSDPCLCPLKLPKFTNEEIRYQRHGPTSVIEKAGKRVTNAMDLPNVIVFARTVRNEIKNGTGIILSTSLSHLGWLRKPYQDLYDDYLLKSWAVWDNNKL